MRTYSLDDLLRLKAAFPQKHWSVILLMLFLVEVRDEQEATMSKIAERMHVSTAAATGLVDAAEQLGFAARFRIPGDRRLVAVKLTARGRALFESLNRAAA
ncbi:MAG: MarR family transcriptional regulator [Pararhizobium sp.]